MSDFLTISYIPDPNVEPSASYDPHTPGKAGGKIPALTISARYTNPFIRVQLDPERPSDTVRYLRQLAAVATDLADQVEQYQAEREREVAEAVLLS